MIERKHDTKRLGGVENKMFKKEDLKGLKNDFISNSLDGIWHYNLLHYPTIRSFYQFQKPIFQII